MNAGMGAPSPHPRGDGGHTQHVVFESLEVAQTPLLTL